MRRIDHLVVHCAATPPSLDIGRDEIDQWHKARGWSGIGYHFVIRRDGTVESGRPLERAGAHVAGHNRHSVGICLVGGVAADGRTPEPNFMPEQWKALRRVLFDLRRRWPSVEILGHRDFAGVAKACPSFDVRAWWGLMPKDPREE